MTLNSAISMKLLWVLDDVRTSLISISDLNVEFEQDGGGEDYLRPVIIYKKFNNEVFWAIPLTHTDKKTKYYFQLTKESDSPTSTAILSQIRLVDARRLSHKLENNVSKEDFAALTKKFKALLP